MGAFSAIRRVIATGCKAPWAGIAAGVPKGPLWVRDLPSEVRHPAGDLHHGSGRGFVIEISTSVVPYVGGRPPTKSCIPRLVRATMERKRGARLPEPTSPSAADI